MTSGPSSARVTVAAASRAFARHAHAGPLETRDLHYLRDLRTLTVETIQTLGAADTTTELIAYQHETVLAVERARAGWRNDPVSAAAGVETRVTRVMRFVLGPQQAVTRRPRTVENLERSIADAIDAFVHAGVSDVAVERRLRAAAERCARAADRIGLERTHLADGALAEHLHAELDASLEAHARLQPTWRLRLAMGADRVLDAWRQLVALGVDPPHAQRVIAASRALARADRQTRAWDRLSEDSISWVAPRDPDRRA